MINCPNCESSNTQTINPTHGIHNCRKCKQIFDDADIQEATTKQLIQPYTVTNDYITALLKDYNSNKILTA